MGMNVMKFAVFLLLVSTPIISGERRWLQGNESEEEPPESEQNGGKNDGDEEENGAEAVEDVEIEDDEPDPDEDEAGDDEPAPTPDDDGDDDDDDDAADDEPAPENAGDPEDEEEIDDNDDDEDDPLDEGEPLEPDNELTAEDQEEFTEISKPVGIKTYRAQMDGGNQTADIKGVSTITIGDSDAMSGPGYIQAEIKLNGDKSCFPKGKLQLHMHSFWKNNETDQAAGEFCAAEYTGNHYDPTVACGPSTSNTQLCETYLLSTSLGSYQCKPQKYEKSRFITRYVNGVELEQSLCQIGDWNNKAGTAKDISDPPQAHYLFQTKNKKANGLFSFRYYDPLQVDKGAMESIARSIVVHCVNGTRVACAKFYST